MSKIENTKVGREDGGWTRLFNNKEFGALFSRTHATMIRAGTELEKMIAANHLDTMTEEEANNFILGKNNYNIKKRYIITKSIIKKILKPYIGCSKEPDFVILFLIDEKCYIIELKDGDTFDTKKSTGEVLTLDEFADKFKLKFPAYEVYKRVCSFNLENKTKIVAGLKNRITLEEAMTGKEFCDLIGVSYSSIVAQRENEGPENIDFFLKELLKIKDAKGKILDLLK